MRLRTTALVATVAAVLAGCSGIASQPSSVGSSSAGTPQSHVDAHGKFHPQWAYPAALAPQNRIELRGATLTTKSAPDARDRAAEGGIYGSTFYLTTINGYPHKNVGNGPPMCSLTGSYVNGIAVDRKGDLIDPDGGTATPSSAI